MEKRTVVFAPEAEADLIAIYEWIAEKAGPQVALGYVERLTDAAAGLSIGGERGTLRNDIREGLRIVGFERRVTIAFAVDEQSVTVLRFFWGGHDWESTLS